MKSRLKKRCNRGSKPPGALCRALKGVWSERGPTPRGGRLGKGQREEGSHRHSERRKAFGRVEAKRMATEKRMEQRRALFAKYDQERRAVERLERAAGPVGSQSALAQALHDMPPQRLPKGILSLAPTPLALAPEARRHRCAGGHRHHAVLSGPGRERCGVRGAVRPEPSEVPQRQSNGAERKAFSFGVALGRAIGWWSGAGFLGRQLGRGPDSF